MKFGFMEDFRNPAPWRRPFPELYAAILRQVERAEDLGYDEVFLTEHHFTEDGYSPSPLPIASGSSPKRTTRRATTACGGSGSRATSATPLSAAR
jgi:alkanesulfonate monooxygenase SsuD/methylene tetrahydromethanopterin reductase-like flavin-dependent oxidoreductase (luciferase family)